MGKLIKVDFRRKDPFTGNPIEGHDRYMRNTQWVLRLIAVITILATAFLLN